MARLDIDRIEAADEALLVKEESIIRGMRLLYEHSGLIVEPAAALGVALYFREPGNIQRTVCSFNLMWQ
jgi:threonine dehydratase